MLTQETIDMVGKYFSMRRRHRNRMNVSTLVGKLRSAGIAVSDADVNEVMRYLHEKKYGEYNSTTQTFTWHIDIAKAGKTMMSVQRPETPKPVASITIRKGSIEITVKDTKEAINLLTMLERAS